MEKFNYTAFLDGFKKAWKEYAEFVVTTTGLREEDYEVCKDVLKVLKSDVLHRLADEIMLGEVVSRKTINEAEDLDRTLNKLKVIPLPTDKVTKKVVESIFNSCVSFYRFLIEMKLRGEGKLVD